MFNFSCRHQVNDAASTAICRRQRHKCPRPAKSAIDATLHRRTHLRAADCGSVYRSPLSCLSPALASASFTPSRPAARRSHVDHSEQAVARRFVAGTADNLSITCDEYRQLALPGHVRGDARPK